MISIKEHEHGFQFLRSGRCAGFSRSGHLCGAQPAPGKRASASALMEFSGLPGGLNAMPSRTFRARLFRFWTQSPLTLDVPIALAAAPFEAVCMTVGSVVDQISRALRVPKSSRRGRSTPSSSTWTAWTQFGLPPSAPWPVEGPNGRLSPPAERGIQEGWIIRVDVVELAAGSEYDLCRASRSSTSSRCRAHKCGRWR